MAKVVAMGTTSAIHSALLSFRLAIWELRYGKNAEQVSLFDSGISSLELSPSANSDKHHGNDVDVDIVISYEGGQPN